MITWLLWLGLGGLSLVLALREFGWLTFNIPQWRRQTGKTWYARLGPIGAAWWWGLDLGSGLTTLVTFSGYWLLVLAALLKGIPLYGGLVLGLYGLGRALSVALTPFLFNLKGGENLWTHLDALLAGRLHLRRWHGYGLLGLALGLLMRGVMSW